MGAGALYLPAMQGVRPVSLLDCLFTATSAVCVTGLITVDTATAWSAWGQGVILLLLQLGGLGIMTFSVALLHLAGRRPSLRSHLALRGALGAVPAQEMGRLTKNVILYTLTCEAVGAGLLFLRFLPDHPTAKAMALASFHAVSAFCNAGFSLFSNSLEGYHADWLVNLTVIALIVLGGLGFLVLRELKDHLRWWGVRHRRRMSLHTRMVLITSIILILGGAAFLWILEYLSGSDPYWGKGFLAALFTSVTARTAGFNTVPLTELSNASLLIVIFLMFVGASPGSCGGGVKTTALATLFALARNRMRGLPGASLAGRGISSKQLGEAMTLIMGSLLVIMIGTLLLVSFDVTGATHGMARGDVLTHAFEAVSAFGTVGLSMGVTSTLSPASKLVLISLMFIGRLGPLTFIYTIGSRFRMPVYTPAEERVMLG